jgi:dTDP-4-amino-4,6-dideoxygalactose transaminase
MSFEAVGQFENSIAKFFNAPYAVATDSCTHAIELCLKYTGADKITVPVRTYISVPFLSEKMSISLEWTDDVWQDYYKVGEPDIYDAAVFWSEGGYIPGSMMCLSFQYQKHLSLGRGGMILLDNETSYKALKKMSYDGRDPGIPWREQNINTVGYHYYMTPETAIIGMEKLPQAILTKPRKWLYNDWPNLRDMDVFK